eukprot:474878-Pyramimonas_sp.AAC.1
MHRGGGLMHHGGGLMHRGGGLMHRGGGLPNLLCHGGGEPLLQHMRLLRKLLLVEGGNRQVARELLNLATQPQLVAPDAAQNRVSLSIETAAGRITSCLMEVNKEKAALCILL